MKIDENKVSNLMDKLGITREEAIQVIEDDYAIDHNEKLFELDASQKKVAKEMCRVDSEKQKNKGNGIPKKRAKKIDDDKMVLVDAILSAVDGISTDLKTVHEGREFTCLVNGKKFKISISQPRS